MMSLATQKLNGERMRSKGIQERGCSKSTPSFFFSIKKRIVSVSLPV